MPRLITISNRLPISLVEQPTGEFVYKPSTGGLATGLKSFHQHNENLWVGWPGTEILNPEAQSRVTKKMAADDMLPVFLTESDIEDFYEGFSNMTLWPLFHYFKLYTEYNPYTWKRYCEVNRRYATELFKVARPDDVFWVHDYQLMLLPQMIREKFPDATIGFFLHIPFPSYEMFRSLPWRKELLHGVLGADLIGFHTYDYVRHFLSATRRILDAEHSLGRVQHGRRVVDVDSFPMGIDYQKFATAIQKPATIQELVNLRHNFAGGKIILSVDRLDYSKGIYQRLEAYDQFLQDHPEYIGRVSLVMVVVPSRANVEQYQKLKVLLDKTIGRLNGQYSTPEWTAIQYYYRPLPFDQLAALYYCSDIALITPFRDGMNLIAKEFVATKADQRGVLILSEMAGASKEMTEAISINPNDIQGIANALYEAINMPAEEQVRRMTEMQTQLRRYDVTQWAELFIERMHEARSMNQRRELKHWNDDVQRELLKHYQTATKRLILFDYDGSLVNFVVNPLQARPDRELISLLRDLTHNERNTVVVVSGRDRAFLEELFEDLPLSIVAEHNVWQHRPESGWKKTVNSDDSWKGEIKQVLDSFVDRTPGSFIEEKEYSMAWHYRVVDSGLGEMRIHELTELLSHKVTTLNLQVIEGNKVIEVRTAGINKGHAARQWVSEADWDFVMAVGDDYTDEEMFKVLPKEAYTLKVGYQDTVARYNVESVAEVRSLISALNLTAGISEQRNSVRKETV
ncbi:MAG: bifunctional alpha,alpha-trehalose-phosphate synthase (UDP-forming)/trehalose-phosphatase [Catalinimonas sp.]